MKIRNKDQTNLSS